MSDADGTTKWGQEEVYWWDCLQKCGERRGQGSPPGLVGARVHSISMSKPEAGREEP